MICCLNSNPFFLETVSGTENEKKYNINRHTIVSNEDVFQYIYMGVGGVS